jgi:hypothetical protein
MKQTQPMNTPEATDVSRGWLDLYEAGAEGVATWSESPPPFLERLRAFLPSGS